MQGPLTIFKTVAYCSRCGRQKRTTMPAGDCLPLCEPCYAVKMQEVKKAETEAANKELHKKKTRLNSALASCITNALSVEPQED